MQRDPRLHGLSSDHHHALAFARSLADRAAAGRLDPAAACEVAARFDRELDPHFRIEEEVLLPALRLAGEAVLVQKTEADHARIREHAAAAAAGRTDGLAAFAERLADHVRFEERELLPRCEAMLPASVLDETARRAPKGS